LALEGCVWLITLDVQENRHSSRSDPQPLSFGDFRLVSPGELPA
jgi:hypothetical protein